MPSPTLSLVCRRRLGRIGFNTAFQWHARANFISLTNSAPRTSAKAHHELQKLKEELFELGESSERPIAGQGVVAGSGPGPHSATNNAGDMLESLFDNILTPPPPITRPPRTKSSEPPQDTSLDIYKQADALKKMLHGSYPLKDSWAFFLEQFVPNFQVGSSLDRHKMPSYISTTAIALLKRIVKAKAADPVTDRLPSVAEVSQVYLQLALLPGTWWSEMVQSLLERLLKVDESAVMDSETEKRLIGDLLGAWNAVCRDPGKMQHFPPPGTPTLDWSYTPSISSKGAYFLYRKDGTISAFTLVAPVFPVRQSRSIPLLATATFGVLACGSPIARRAADITPIFDVLSPVIGMPELELSDLDDSIDTPATAIDDYLRHNWSLIRDTARKMSSPYKAPPSKADIAKETTRDLMRHAFKSATVVEKVRAYLSKRNLAQVDELWSSLTQPPTDPKISAQSRHRHTLSEEELSTFILAYIELKRPNRAIEVWNYMVKSGLTPGQHTWNAMLAGCSATRDAEALEQIWQKLTAVIEPDVYCWTTRIGGLFSCSRINEGLEALDTMGRKWLQAAKKENPKMNFSQLATLGDVKGAVKPTIATINAALVALLRRRRGDVATNILSWAAKYEIAPNAVTYNTLLRPLCRLGQSREVIALIVQMKESGIQPDAGTFTTILDELFYHEEDIKPEEQKELILTIFKEMENSGIKPTEHTYGKIIYHLLQTSKNTGDMTLVNLVIDLMGRQGIRPSAHIYTILIEYHFDQYPPNLDFIRQIIDRAERSHKATDFIFWDRCVEGYSRCGQTAPALRILGNVHAAGGKVGWNAQKSLMLALVESQEVDLARMLVRNAYLDSGGPPDVEARGKQDQHWFWHTARELRLMPTTESLGESEGGFEAW